GRTGDRVCAVRGAATRSLQGLEPRDIGALEFVGFLAFSDPLRPSSKRAIQGIRRAGVRTLMLTGDHPSTARAIAEGLGLLGDRRVVSGSELAHSSDEELDAM